MQGNFAPGVRRSTPGPAPAGGLAQRRAAGAEGAGTVGTLRSAASTLTDAITSCWSPAAKPYRSHGALEERGAHARLVLPRDLDGRIGAGDAKVRRPALLDGRLRHPLPLEFGVCVSAERLHSPRPRPCRRRSSRYLDAAPPDAAALRQPDAPGRQHSGERVQQQRVDAEQLGHCAGVLSRGAAEGHQCELLSVLAVTQCELVDGVGHFRNGDLEERRCQPLDRVARSRRSRRSRPRSRPAAHATLVDRAARLRRARTRSGSARAGCGRARRCSRSRWPGHHGDSTPGLGRRLRSRARPGAGHRRNA
jgi:hypothetical protein